MKPPICELCDQRFDPPDGALVRFVGDERSIEWRRASEVEGFVGHPPDEAWFCGDHMSDARALADELTLHQALEALGHPSTQHAAGSTERHAEDDLRQVIIAPISVDALGERLQRFFDALIDAIAEATGITPCRDDDDVATSVEQFDSPEWREKGPASESVESTIIVPIGDWECHCTRVRHVWLHGGLVQSSASVSVLHEVGSTTKRIFRVGGGSHAGSPVGVVSVFGALPGVAETLLDELLDELTV